MEVDLARRPEPPGPRWPGWVVLSVAWGVGTAVAIVLLVLGPSPAILLLLPAIVGLAYVQWYSQRRLGIGMSIWSQRSLATGDPVGDPELEVRTSDPEERAAFRDLHHGRISRKDYERIRLRRRFVHGEVTRAEYHETLREIDQAPEPAGR